MTKTAFDRDGILTPEDRAASGRKCIQILSDASESRLGTKSLDFLLQQRKNARYVSYAPSERQLLWLRDLVDKHIA